MPSLWKKHKGNRISRFVADLQTPTKRCESLVVETGFPTSIIDLFVKNRNRLKKPSKTKKQFKEQATSLVSEKEKDPFVSLSKLDVPSVSIDEKNQETVAQVSDFGFCVEETVTQKTPFVEEKERANGGCLSLNKGIWVSILKWVLVLVVGLYTKGFVVGITIGAFLLHFLEFAGNLVFQFCKPCKGNENEEKVVFEGSIRVGTKGVNNNGRGVISESAIDHLENGITPRKKIDEANVGGCCMDGVVQIESECEIEEVIEPNNVCVMTNNSNLDSPSDYGKFCSRKGIIRGEGEEKESECSKSKVVDKGKTRKVKKFWKKFISKHISKKKKPKQGKEKDIEGCRHEVPTDYIESSISRVDEGGDQKGDKQKMVDCNEFSLSSSFHEMVENHNTNSSYNERLQKQNISTKSSRVVVNQGLNLKCLVVMGIALSGLITSRILALVLTLICCVGFKLNEKLTIA